jgi:hypothetical protein
VGAGLTHIRRHVDIKCSTKCCTTSDSLSQGVVSDMDEARSQLTGNGVSSRAVMHKLVHRY